MFLSVEWFNQRFTFTEEDWKWGAEDQSRINIATEKVLNAFTSRMRLGDVGDSFRIDKKHPMRRLYAEITSFFPDVKFIAASKPAEIVDEKTIDI